MRTWYERVKPQASSRTQLLLAGGMWITVGGALVYFGASWILEGRHLQFSLLLVGIGVLLGIAKAAFILDRAAVKMVERIGERGEEHCAGSFLSLRSWIVVAAMILLGRVLRGGLLPAGAVGTLYVAIGTGLLVSSRLALASWWRGSARDSRALISDQRPVLRIPEAARTRTATSTSTSTTYGGALLPHQTGHDGEAAHDSVTG